MPKIPDTGRIGRIARAIKKETDQDTLEKVMMGVQDCVSTSDHSKKARWTREAMGRLEELAGKEKCKRIMESCGRKCCGVTSRKRAKQCAGTSRTIGELIENMNKMRIGGGRLRWTGKDTIVGGYDRCYCGLVSKTKEAFPDLSYCQCSVGWYKQLFEAALGKPVEVEIKRSIICGAKSCEFLIRIQC
jgi:hypothetical protein